MNILLLSIFLAFSSVLGQEIILESPRVTNWGDWAAQMEVCPPNEFVYGMRLKVHDDQGTFGDDSALNGIELFCISPLGKRNVSVEVDPKQGFTVIKSTEGYLGSYKSIIECPNPLFAIGFQLRSEDDQGWFDDDTAANNLRLICSNGDVLDGNGMGWGGYTEERRCPRGSQLCGIQTQVESRSDSDDTTLNNVNMGCCAVP